MTVTAVGLHGRQQRRRPAGVPGARRLLPLHAARPRRRRDRRRSIAATPGAARARASRGRRTSRPAPRCRTARRPPTPAARSPARATSTEPHRPAARPRSATRSTTTACARSTPSGNATASADQTFTSARLPDAAAVRRVQRRDARHRRSWAFVDPLGDSSASRRDRRTPQISVPAGQAHDLWSTVRTVPRLLQAAPNGDFEVETKFDTGVTTHDPAAGHRGRGEPRQAAPASRPTPRARDASCSSPRSPAAPRTCSTTATCRAARPCTCKLRRVGNRWTFSYSNDGESWRSTRFDRALDVTAIGPYVGNGGNTPPAFQGRIDYFREITDRTPPVITPGQSRAPSAARRRSRGRRTSRRAPSSSTARAPAPGRRASGPRRSRRATAPSPPGLACATDLLVPRRSRPTRSATLATSADDRRSRPRPARPPAARTSTSGAATRRRSATVGVPQTWVNVIGNVSDPDGVQSLQGSAQRRRARDAQLHAGRLAHPAARRLQLRGQHRRPDARRQRRRVARRPTPAGA